jgi:NADH:ubiquinone oxidoreductase subunit F (NADH-binding)
MNDWCIELAAAVIRRAVWDLKLIAKTDERKKVIAEYIKLGGYRKTAEALGMKEQEVRKIVTDDRIGRDAYDFLTGERLKVWGKMTRLDTQYLRKEIAKYNNLSFTPNIVE